jgi:predicted nucleotidyltransferase
VLDDISVQIAHEARLLLGDKLDRVLLYGSYARGDFDEESDIDIMILADIPASETWQVNMQINTLACRLGLENDVVVAPYVTDSATFYKFLKAMTFYENVMRDGVLLSD